MLIFDNQDPPNYLYGSCDKNCTCGFHVNFGHFLIKEVGVYKYLGVELDKKLSFKDFKTRILGNAKKNLSRIWFMGIKSGDLSIKASMNLWEALVRSQLEYASEIWGQDKWKEGENLQMDMCRRVLHCSSRTSKLAMQGELGLWTLQGRRDLKKLIWWMNILTMEDSRLVKQVYFSSKRLNSYIDKNNWISSIKKILGKYELLTLWKDETKVFNLDGKGNGEAKSPTDHKTFWKRYIKKIIYNYEEKQWRTGMEKKSKLRTLRRFKTSLSISPYLLTTGSYRGKMLMTTLRSGTNALRIETGRWEQLQEHQRICDQCDMKVIENEIHMITQCTRYQNERQELYSKIYQESNFKWNLAGLDVNDQFLMLINGSGDELEQGIYKLFQTFLVRAFKLRK